MFIQNVPGGNFNILGDHNLVSLSKILYGQFPFRTVSEIELSGGADKSLACPIFLFVAQQNYFS
jgi:hypothetical protein